MNIAAHMADTWGEYKRWGDLSLAQIYNIIKSIFDSDVSEGGIRKKRKV